MTDPLNATPLETLLEALGEAAAGRLPELAAGRLPELAAARPSEPAAGRPPEPAAAEPKLSATARFAQALAYLPAGAVPSSLHMDEPVDAEALRAALERALGSSGLFYEAHQAQWLRGERSLAALREEPQGRLPSEDEHRGGAAHSAANGPSDPQALDWVRRQLKVLESGHILWQGELWPHQSAQWRLEEGPAENDGEDAPRPWTSELSLELPGLGALQAHIALDVRGALSLRLAAARPESGALLRGELPLLAQALAARELAVSALQVEHGAA